MVLRIRADVLQTMDHFCDLNLLQECFQSASGGEQTEVRVVGVSAFDEKHVKPEKGDINKREVSSSRATVVVSRAVDDYGRPRVEVMSGYSIFPVNCILQFFRRML